MIRGLGGGRLSEPGSGGSGVASADTLHIRFGISDRRQALRRSWRAAHGCMAPDTDTQQNGAAQAEHGYDHLGRRVQKKVWTYSGGSWDSPVARKYVWSGWLLLMELDDMAGGIGVSPVRKYTWGLDLAGPTGRSPSRSERGLSGADVATPPRLPANG